MSLNKEYIEFGLSFCTLCSPGSVIDKRWWSEAKGPTKWLGTG